MKLENEIQHKFPSERKKAIVNVMYTSAYLLSHVNDLLRPLDLTIQQLNILSIINGQENKYCTVNTIKERMIAKMSNVSRLLNKMVTKGWIKKERSDEDQRVVNIQITDAGIKIMKKGREISDIPFLEASNLNEEESGALNNLLDKMRK